jgi:integrase
MTDKISFLPFFLTSLYFTPFRNLWIGSKLRHTAATLMYKYGHVDIRSLQQILGHESIATTEIYTHVDDRQLQAAVNANPLAMMFN